VMTAYNRLYGEPCSSSKFLIQELLRNAWGFRGHVLSDCWALVDFHQHHRVTKTPSESAARALLAGLDLNCGNTYPHLKSALDEALVQEDSLDRALTRLMMTRLKLGLFDPAGSVPFDALSPELVSSSKHTRLARTAAVKSIVLLKNQNGTLPLRANLKSLMLLGPYVADGHVLLGNYYGGARQLTTLLEGVMSAVEAGVGVEYKYGFLAGRPNLNPIDWVTSAAHEKDAIVVTLGLSGLVEGEEGEAHESVDKGDRKALELPEHQLAFLRKLRRAGNKKIIVVLFGGSAQAIPEVHELADAILLAWYPGQEGGHALADVLFGRQAPGGKLPLTFPKATKDLPPFENYDMRGRTYRYSEQAPLYPFGFGLTYGTVAYESLQLTHASIRAGEAQQAIGRVTNRWQRAVEEVVQLYLTDKDASVPTPKHSLVAFRRVSLKPGETRSIELSIAAERMQVVDALGQRRYEPGEFTVFAGSAAPEPRAVE